MPFARFNLDSCLPCRPAVERLNVVILYEHLAYVSKAVTTYLHLTRDLWPGSSRPTSGCGALT